jgi:methylenetetrahydrofolate dehydrogenase (NADP+) / methenyltetrahydrofolate cyclohydrolase
MTRLIDGRAIASQLADEVKTIVARAARPPALAVVLPSDDEAAKWYVRSIQRTAGRVGIHVQVDELFEAGASALARRLDVLSGDPDVDGIICQTPLPDGLRLADVGSHIVPAKDVDGANPVSLGRLASGLLAFAPATAAAVMEILRREEVRLTGSRAVVVGRSVVVGKPAALLLLAQDATVTVCHSRTAELASVCASADVLVAAVGRPGLVGASFIKPGAVVIDVGTNPSPDGGSGMVGDVAADEAGAASLLTPVPGGVGPVTTMMLMLQTARAASG